MALFDLPKRQDVPKNRTELLLQKIDRGSNTTPVVAMRGSGGKNDLQKTINSIKAFVSSYLSKYLDLYSCIRTEAELEDYISKCIENGYCAIDTETTSLDPITTTIAGFSIYTPGLEPAYIPINHISYVTRARLNDQLSEEFCGIQLNRLKEAGTRIIFFNAKFDIRVIKHTLGVQLKAYWCSYIASMLLNENDDEHGLKALHNKYVLDGKGDAFKFSDLFENVVFIYIPINTAYLYAAHDAKITYELFKFQEPYLTKGTEENIESELEGVSDIFWDIEMPLIDVNVKLEDTGIYFDMELDKKLSIKYNQLLIEKESNFHELVSQYQSEIASYRRMMGANCKLDNPISIGSPQQIAILLYDILKLTSCDKNKPRGTGEEAIKGIKHPVAKAILDYREVAKLISTYIDKLPNEVNKNTERIHAGFNPVGTVTGRFSSSSPNLQNIPAHGSGSEVRNLFAASDGHIMISSDYSGQEPRVMAHMSQDPVLIKAYKENKDAYCVIASVAFDKTYEECKEFWPDGTENKQGKEFRDHAKKIVLGVMYGRGIASIAEQLGVTKPKAKEIYNKVLNALPGLQDFMGKCQDMAFNYGYVDTIWGRKRRLPGIQLQKYEFSRIDGYVSKDFNPLDFEDGIVDDYIDQEIIDYYSNQLDRAWGSKKWEIIEEAKKEGIHIVDNGGKIAEAERQACNARIQGSAADMTKRAMIVVHSDKELNELGFKMLIPVHDEIIGEAPYENALRAGKRLSEIMIGVTSDLSVPFKCDATYFLNWYGKSLNENDINDLITGKKKRKDFTS